MAVIHLSPCTFDVQLEFENVNEEQNVVFRRNPLCKSSNSPFLKQT